ncbi:MAG TPA: hypothetical protein VGQ83_41590 [Polyangia bacterium]
MSDGEGDDRAQAERDERTATEPSPEELSRRKFLRRSLLVTASYLVLPVCAVGRAAEAQGLCNKGCTTACVKSCISSTTVRPDPCSRCTSCTSSCTSGCTKACTSSCVSSCTSSCTKWCTSGCCISCTKPTGK